MSRELQREPRTLEWLEGERKATVGVTDFGEVGGIHPQTVVRMIRRGEIPAVQVGTRFRIPREFALRYFEPLRSA